MSVNNYAFVQTEDSTYSLYKVDGRRSTVIIDQIVDPTVVTVEPPATAMLLSDDQPSDDQPSSLVLKTNDSGFGLKLGDYLGAGGDSVTVDQHGATITVDNPSTWQTLTSKSVVDAAAKTLVLASRRPDNVPLFRSVEQALASVPNREEVDSLTRNTSGYGSTATLCWPADLLSNGSPYNGLYTVFYISEHLDSTIATVSSLVADRKYVNNQGSEMARLYGNMSQGAQLTATALSTVGAIGVGAQSASGLLKGFSNQISALGGSSGSGKESNLKFVTRMIGKAASAPAVVGAAIAAPAVLKIATSLIGGISDQTGSGSSVAQAFDKSNLTKNRLDFKQLKIAIALPTPTIETKSKFKWSDSGSMALAKAAAKFVEMGAKASDAGAGAAKANLTKGMVGKAINYIGAASQAVIDHSDAAMAAYVTSLKSGPGKLVSRLTSSTANTRKEMLFEDVEFRNFDFTYQLAARSKEEMDNIESIIRVFKYHAHPELKEGGEDFLYRYPAQFDIVHYFKDTANPHMPRHATAVLSGVDVTYGKQDSQPVHTDGSPVWITLRLEFQEIAILTKNSIANGY